MGQQIAPRLNCHEKAQKALPASGRIVRAPIGATRMPAGSNDFL
jgi:hypothetical protein